jgi:cellulose synthase/poly-beta-1,6-N-acetylglucosamine synthase-like glycosyltransferase
MMMPLLTSIWNALAAVAAWVTLPGSCELLLLSGAALLPRRRAHTSPEPAEWRAAVLVPAHNEKATITHCVDALLKSNPAKPGTEFTVFVIADNCTDNTARLAEQAGAQVMERFSEANRGKGYALHYAFTHLIALGYDCIIVVDADTQVAPNFVAAAADTLRAGEQAVQARYLVQNATETMRTRLMALALRAFNVVRPLGRDNLGLSCGIGGNGFGLRSEALLAVPYLAASIVEDLEYHIHLVRSGRRVAFLNDATVLAETPIHAKNLRTQRSRWEGGRFLMLATQTPGLLRDVLRGRFRSLEPLLELLLLPLAFHVTLLMVALSAPLAIVRDFGIAGTAIVLLHLIAAIVVGGGGWRDVAILFAAPFYVLWKLLLIPTLIRSANSHGKWIRTGRNAEQPIHIRPAEDP